MMLVNSLFSLILKTHFERVSYICMILHLHVLAVKKLVIVSDIDISFYNIQSHYQFHQFFQ